MDTSKDYYESVMRDFKTYGRGRTLEQYCRDEAVDFSHYLTMLDLNTAQEYWIGSEPTDMRKGRDSLASIVRHKFGKDPKMGSRAFIFYAKNLKTVKILHYSVTGFEMYTKWFDDNKCMKPIFSKIATTHTITRSQLALLLTGAVIRTIKIN